MDQSEIEKNLNIDWEVAVSQYEYVMASGTKDMQVKATIKLAHLIKHAPEHVLVRSISILSEILETDPSNDSDRFLVQASAYCLKSISCRGDGGLAMEIGKKSTLGSLVRLLSRSSDTRFRKVVLKCLRNVVTFCVSSRTILAGNGGLEVIIAGLISSVGDIRRYLLEILSAMALLRDVRMKLVSLRALSFLIDAAKHGSMVSRERACHVIGLLGINGRIRRDFVNWGAIPALVDLFHEGDITTKVAVGNSLGVITSHVDYIRLAAEAGAIPLYAELLAGPESQGKEIAEDAFCLLAVSEGNAAEIGMYLGKILREGDNVSKVAASDVIWNLSGYKHSVEIVQISGAIPILFELLTDASPEVREMVSGAFAELSNNGEHIMALADVGAIQILIEMLQDESEECRDNAAEALINFAEDAELHDRVSDAINTPSFRDLQNRLARLRISDDQLARSLRRQTAENLTFYGM